MLKHTSVAVRRAHAETHQGCSKACTCSVVISSKSETTCHRHDHGLLVSRLIESLSLGFECVNGLSLKGNSHQKLSVANVIELLLKSFFGASLAYVQSLEGS